MANKLAVNILKDDQIIASVIYENGASTQGTFDKLRRLRDILEKSGRVPAEIDGVELALIRGLEEDGGGAHPDKINMSRAKSEFPNEQFNENPNPEAGLLAIAPSVIRDANMYGKGEPEPSILDLDILAASNHSYFVKKAKGVNTEDVPEVTDFSLDDMDDIPFGKLEKVAQEVSELPDEFISSNGMLVIKL